MEHPCCERESPIDRHLKSVTISKLVRLSLGDDSKKCLQTMIVLIKGGGVVLHRVLGRPRYINLLPDLCNDVAKIQ